MLLRTALVVVLTCSLGLTEGFAQSSDAPPASNETATDSDQVPSDRDALLAAFTKKMSGATLTGHFTIDGADQDLSDLTEERYEIVKVARMPGTDLWLFTTRIMYDRKDLTDPVPLQIKWAGETPVITMEKIAIPGMGTFSARVLIHDRRYAGTWQHDDVGGHLFGRVATSDEAAAADAG
ncbi:MAG: hypothetical protein AAGF97_03740 [Planctomycetota bacterium]